MAVYVEIQTDTFSQNMDVVELNKKRAVRSARRPYRGIEIKDDTFAVIKVIRADGSEIPLTDSGGEISGQVGPSQKESDDTSPDDVFRGSRLTSTVNYSNFIIQGVVEAREEKSQIMETFGDAYVFFFGEKPRFLQVQGLLMNTLDFNWRTEFWYNYEHVLRGTKLVEQNARIYLYWDDLLVEGYMMNAQAQDNAELPYHIPFSFSLFVTNHTYLSQIGVDDYPIRNPAFIEPLQRESAMDARIELKEYLKKASVYASSVDRVRRTNINTVRRQQFGQYVHSPKSTLTDVARRAINDTGFGMLNIIGNRFFAKPVVFPKGLAGAESYSGLPQYANKAYKFPWKLEREEPFRGKIRENIDEYTGERAYGFAAGDWYKYSDYVNKTLNEKKNRTCFDMELKCVLKLAEMGLDVTRSPYGLAAPFSCISENVVDAFTELGAAWTPDFFRTFNTEVPLP